MAMLYSSMSREAKNWLMVGLLPVINVLAYLHCMSIFLSFKHFSQAILYIVVHVVSNASYVPEDHTHAISICDEHSICY